MTKVSTLFTKFISAFIEKNCSEDVNEIWNDEAKDEFIKIIEKELKKKTSTKKEKKPATAPKGARTSYIFFCMEERPKVNEEFPELSNQDKVKVMAERWNKAKENEEVLNYYKNLAEEDKKRAAEDKENYLPVEEDEDENKGKEKGKKEKKEKKEKKGGVKRTKTGYQIYCVDERPTVKEEGFTGAEITTELARRWKVLKEKDEDMYSEYMEKSAKLKEAPVEDEERDEEKPKKKKPEPKKKKATQKKKVVEESDEEDIVDEE